MNTPDQDRAGYQKPQIPMSEERNNFKRPMSLNTQPPSRSSSLRLDLPYTAAAVPYASPFEERDDNPLDIKPLTVADKNALTPLRGRLSALRV